MFFYALTSVGPRGWCWNPSLKGEGFKDPEDLAEVSVSENLHAFARYCSNTKMNFSKRFSKVFKWLNDFQSFQMTKWLYAIITIKHGFLIY